MNSEKKLTGKGEQMTDEQERERDEKANKQ